MTSDMTLHYETDASTATTPTLQVFMTGTEACFGLARGCRVFHSMDNSTSFASFSAPRKNDERLVALHGSVSNSSLSPEMEARLGSHIPTGEWSTTDDVYVLSDCSEMPRGRQEAADWYTSLPKDAIHVFSLTMKGDGMQSLQKEINEDVSGVVMPKGGCLAHLVRRTGDGGIDTEFQVAAYVRREGADPKAVTRGASTPP